MKAPRKQKTLGILDLYGYENPDQVPGGFEQLVINFANEKLQQVITDWTLGAEQEEYVSEAIEWTHIDYPNNRYEKRLQRLCSMYKNITHGFIAVKLSVSLNEAASACCPFWTRSASTITITTTTITSNTHRWHHRRFSIIRLRGVEVAAAAPAAALPLPPWHSQLTKRSRSGWQIGSLRSSTFWSSLPETGRRPTPLQLLIPPKARLMKARWPHRRGWRRRRRRRHHPGTAIQVLSREKTRHCLPIASGEHLVFIRRFGTNQYVDFVYFRINHSAGQVTYDCRDFVARNKDSLDRNLSQAMYECDHSLLKILFPEGAITSNTYNA